jgi:hypothetical protein
MSIEVSEADFSQASRSFEDPSALTGKKDAAAAGRLRANTAPVDLPGVPKAPSEDDDVRQAKALALAIHENPHLTVEEAQKLATLNSRNHEKKKLLLPAMLSQVFSKASSSTDTTNHNSPTEGGKPAEKVKRSFHRARNLLRHSDHAADEVAHPPSTTSASNSNTIRASFRQRHVNPRSPRSPPVSPRPDLGALVEEEEGRSPGGIQASPSWTQPPPLTSAPSIRLTCLAWKRRGGMGKYSTTSAWERRRIELRGQKIFYYKTEADDGEDDDGSLVAAPSQPTAHNINNNNSLGSAASASMDDATEGVVVARRSTWFEQAWNNAATVEADPAQPRGHIHLAREMAVVAAALGHSGAPSPFAISIKVRGETKWKLCFDHHRDQMEWLAALTDVTVQVSVDAYNQLLLEAADPTHAIDGTPALFTASAVAAPPGGHKHRLWQVESYQFSNGGASANEGADSMEDVVGPTDMVEDFQEAEHAFATAPVAVRGGSAGLTKSKDSQQQLATAVAVLNTALIFARSSSTSLNSFWYVVAVANLGLFSCFSKKDVREAVPFGAAAASGTTGATPSPAALSASSTRTSLVVASTPSVDAKDPKGKSKGAKPGFIPVAGTTTVKLKNPTDPPAIATGELFAGWRNPSADCLMVRSLGYSQHKKKLASPGELYHCAQVEVFESPSRYPDMARKVKLPKVHFTDDGPKTWRTPDIFVVSIALPTDPPKLGRSSSDGGGYTVTMYFTMKQETRDILKRVTADGYDPSSETPDNPGLSQVNAVRLLEEWCRRAPDDANWFSRFKVVPNAHNLKEIGMPGWISKYNGKPFLIKRPGVTGFIHQHPELSCFEFDISLHPFPYLAKQGICFMKDSYFKKVLVTFGFVIEGKTDDELPECVLGCMQLCYPDPAHAIQASDYFAGTAPRSF